MVIEYINYTLSKGFWNFNSIHETFIIVDTCLASVSFSDSGASSLESLFGTLKTNKLQFPENEPPPCLLNVMAFYLK